MSEKIINSEAIITKEETDANTSVEKSTTEKFTHVLKNPVKYQELDIDMLSFDFSKLTGADALAIENEMQQLGMTAVVPALSSEFLIRMAAKACTQPIGSDIFTIMGIYDFNKIKSAARSFLLSSE